MEKTKKKQVKDIANAPLDTSGLRPIGYPFDVEKDDSFAAEFERYIHAEAKHILEEEDNRSFEEGDRNAFAVTDWREEGPDAADMTMRANKFFVALNLSVARHMHNYLLQHNGKVKQWPDPESSLTLSYAKDGYQFRYNYFSGGYTDSHGKIFREKEPSYCSRYVYRKEIPNQFTARLERDFTEAHSNERFHEKENKALEEAKSVLEQAKAEDEKIAGAKMGMVLTGLLVVLAGLATAICRGLPIDLTAAAKTCTGFLSNLWTSLPKGLNILVCVLLAIPIYVLAIVLMFTGTIGSILHEFSLLGTGWAVGCYVLLWGAVLVAALLLGLPLVFKKNPLPAARKAYDGALDIYSHRLSES